jgi:hypothetical protein
MNGKERRDREFADSPLEGTRFEPSVPSGQAFWVDGKFKFWGGLAYHIWGCSPNPEEKASTADPPERRG